MSQAVNAVTSSSKTKRQYRKGNAMTASEKQLASIARKRATHKEINVFVRNPLKEQLIELCSDEGINQGQMIEMLIEREANRRLAKK
ncbi:replication regulatory protein RepA [Serratia nevei]|uniref:replication regulatory protein RepA n=1 Tax=Serratia nevei TaxID=2703794 RepID=UPI0011CAB035|nr:replication regulatory protein RepA [Serratia nevei]TXE69797.1 replication regulatory protein RepA [Serratia nevei]